MADSNSAVNAENINDNADSENIEKEKKGEKTQNNINSIVNIEFLTPSNAEFSITENGFLQLKATVPNPEKENAVESVEFERVFLHRAFPFEMPYKYISVFGAFPKAAENAKPDDKSDKSKDKTDTEDTQDTKQEKDGENKDSEDNKPKENVTSVGDLKEIGIISDINVFGALIQDTLKTALNSKYFTSVIELIYSIKDKYGYSYWDVKTNVGRVKFTVNDTYRSLLKVTDDRIIVNDINGNRYEIPSLKKFDKNSYRKIELFF